MIKASIKKYNEEQQLKRSAYNHAKSLMDKYGMTVETYDSMFDKQGGACFICKRPPKVRRLAVDHDHTTGKVRGLLCWRCNSGLEKFSDNPHALTRAVLYLLREG